MWTRTEDDRWGEIATTREEESKHANMDTHLYTYDQELKLVQQYLPGARGGSKPSSERLQLLHKCDLLLSEVSSCLIKKLLTAESRTQACTHAEPN